MTRRISVIYKILTALALLTGIVLNLFKTTSAISLLSYYTLQSNILCFIAFISYSAMEIRNINKKCKKGDIYYLIKGAMIIMIFITALFYHIALVPVGFTMELDKTFIVKRIANFFVHTISPCLVILDYFLFDKKGKFKGYYPFLWLFFPFNYVIYVYFYASQGGTFYNIGGSNKFAYFFLDYIEIGIWGVVKWIIFMTIGILLVSYIVVVIDRKLGQKKRARKKVQ